MARNVADGVHVAEHVADPVAAGTPDVLTLAEAAALAGVSVQALRARAQRGSLRVARTVRRGRVVVAVERCELERAYPSPLGGSATLATQRWQRAAERSASARASAQGEDPSAVVAHLDGAEVSRLREELAAERERRLRLEGEVAVAERVERALQAYADRLEGRWDGARREVLSLARALGQAEAARDALRLRLEAHGRGGWVGRLLGR